MINRDLRKRAIADYFSKGDEENEVKTSDLSARGKKI
jgi:hypothetical protein